MALELGRGLPGRGGHHGVAPQHARRGCVGLGSFRYVQMVTAANWVTSDRQVDDLVEVLPDPVAGGAEVAADLELKMKTFLYFPTKS